MNAKQIRSTFIDFFKSKGHQFVPSAPIVVKNDPTLMFTNAGMNQFKDFFLGNDTPQYSRVSNSQKCLRVSGKHNDLEEVGVDTYHHTMFEMLGNWSFGDYFKEEAIAWAWELLTEVYGLPVDRMYVTVFGGDQADGLDRDLEALELWGKWIAKERILFGSKKDNFWEMGESGPCGPCSEIHVDLRSEEERQLVNGKDLVNQDHPQVIEIWNLVFIQYNRTMDGALKELPAKHVDTGMGLERLVRVIQWKQSNYDTDLFQPFIHQLEALSGISYGSDEKTDIAFRVIVDHIRAISFTIADGQLPSNNKAGYVIRRILRRAVRYGYTFLNFKEPFLHLLLPTLSDHFGEVFPEVTLQQEFISRVIKEEELSFLRTLDKGLKILDQLKSETSIISSKIIPGSQVFELYDTYGFPLDLTSLIARENGLSVDEVGFNTAMEVQKTRSRAAAEQETGDWVIVKREETVEFVGYDQLHTLCQVLKYRVISEKKGKKYQLVLNRTPFYAESGGQVGDQGTLLGETETIQVLDTKKENDLIIHEVNKLPVDTSQSFNAQVNEERRLRIMNNHTATHLLQSALRQVLGNHIQQKGSLVNEELLRFDFSHYAKLTDGELTAVETIVNERIRANIHLDEKRDLPIAEAKALGATALFGEKYGEFVRVITFGRDFSVELCGGTHVQATGNIGFFKIISEGSISAGVRRIEAITSVQAEAYVREQLRTLKDIQELLKAPRDVKKSVAGLLQEKNELRKEVEGLHLKQAAQIKDQLLGKIHRAGDLDLLVASVTLPSADALKKLSFELKNESDRFVGILIADIGGKPQIAVVVDEQVVAEKQYDAGKIVRELAKNIQGGGGGQPFFATAGGKDLEGIPLAVKHAKEILSYPSI